ncbi:MAG: nickel-binding protein [Nitrososphaeraceae archaeon]
MARFLDTHKIGTFTEEQLERLQKSAHDVFGVHHINILYNHEAGIMYCLHEAPDAKAVETHHDKLGFKCEWIIEIKTTA